MKKSFTRFLETCPRAVRISALWTLFILCLLQLWRPYFFLTDDNLTGWLPIQVHAARRLWSGRSPFINDYLFGGHYDLLHDTSALNLWNPFNLASSFLVKTGGYFALVDLFCSFNLLLCAVAFALLLCRLRQAPQAQAPDLSDNRIVFLTLSFTFSTYTLLVAPSWANFSANQAALPILGLGLLEPRRARGIPLIAFGLGHALLAGHLHPFLFTLLFFTVFVAGLSCTQRSWEPLLRWLCGGLAAALLAAPLLIPAVSGFAGTARSQPLTIRQMAGTAVPLPVFVTSFFVGSFSILTGVPYYVGNNHQGHAFGIASCAASFVFWHGLKARRKPSGWEWVLLLLTLLAILFVVRPAWLSLALSRLPLFSSLRWPFREILLFQFFIHLWMASRPVTLSPRACRLTAVVGVMAFLMSILPFGPPTLSSMKLDQQLVLSGQAQDYWDRVKASLGPADRVVGAAPVELLTHNLLTFPFVLLGGFNYPALYEVPSISGYWITGFKGNPALGERPHHRSGIFSPEAAERLKAKDPHLKVLTLVSLRPMKIELSDAHDRTPVELPPLVQQAVAPSTGAP